MHERMNAWIEQQNVMAETGRWGCCGGLELVGSNPSKAVSLMSNFKNARIVNKQKRLSLTPLALSLLMVKRVIRPAAQMSNRQSAGHGLTIVSTGAIVQNYSIQTKNNHCHDLIGASKITWRAFKRLIGIETHTCMTRVKNQWWSIVSQLDYNDGEQRQWTLLCNDITI